MEKHDSLSQSVCKHFSIQWALHSVKGLLHASKWRNPTPALCSISLPIGNTEKLQVDGSERSRFNSRAFLRSRKLKKRKNVYWSIVSCSISSFNVAFRGQALSFKTYFVLKHPRKQWKITKDANLNFNYICIICNMYINNLSFTVHKYVRCKRFSTEFRTEMMSSEIHSKVWLSRDILFSSEKCDVKWEKSWWNRI